MTDSRTTILAQLEPLEEVAHCQSNRLHDVSVLLKAIQASVEAGPYIPTGSEMAALRDGIHRLARMADDVLEGVQDAFQPYI
jgi:hypothetical protein